MTLEPVSAALKFGFIAVLYLFLMWVARSALKDLRRGAGVASPPPDATGLHPASGVSGSANGREPQLVVRRAPGHAEGMIYDIGEGAILGRGDGADIRLDDPFASSRHARLVPQGGVIVLEDLGSTNGTFLNDELVQGPQPLHPGDRVRIGDSEFTYQEEG
jgi:pSer/pThr/pTyr-binding forkhead associated (FHA) protein